SSIRTPPRPARYTPGSIVNGILGQRLGNGAREPRRFVHLETEAMTGRMPEGRAESARLDRFARERICVPAGHPCAYPFARAQLRILDHRVQRALRFIGASAHDDGPRHI